VRAPSRSCSLSIPPPPRSTLFPYTTLFRSNDQNFLALLRLVRSAVGNDVPISAAIPPDWSPIGVNIPVPPLIVPGTVWDREYKRSEEHTSELQSREKLVCRLLLEKKNRATR